MGEFGSPAALLDAATGLKARGYRDLDAFTPYPVAGLAELLRLPRSRLPYGVFACGLTGALFAYGLMWFVNGIDYPIDVGARPGHAPPAFVPITFETCVLAAGIAAFVLALALAGLPRLHAPEHAVPGFERATVDRFFLLVGAADPLFEPGRARDDLYAVGALRVEPLVAP
jgi:hypothetical protein